MNQEYFAGTIVLTRRKGEHVPPAFYARLKDGRVVEYDALYIVRNCIGNVKKDGDVVFEGSGCDVQNVATAVEYRARVPK